MLRERLLQPRFVPGFGIPEDFERLLVDSDMTDEEWMQIQEIMLAQMEEEDRAVRGAEGGVEEGERGREVIDLTGDDDEMEEEVVRPIVEEPQALETVRRNEIVIMEDDSDLYEGGGSAWERMDGAEREGGNALENGNALEEAVPAPGIHIEPQVEVNAPGDTLPATVNSPSDDQLASTAVLPSPANIATSTDANPAYNNAASFATAVQDDQQRPRRSMRDQGVQTDMGEYILVHCPEAKRQYGDGESEEEDEPSKRLRTESPVREYDLSVAGPSNHAHALRINEDTENNEGEYAANGRVGGDSDDFVLIEHPTSSSSTLRHNGVSENDDDGEFILVPRRVSSNGESASRATTPTLYGDDE